MYRPTTRPADWPGFSGAAPRRELSRAPRGRRGGAGRPRRSDRSDPRRPGPARALRRAHPCGSRRRGRRVRRRGRRHDAPSGSCAPPPSPPQAPDPWDSCSPSGTTPTTMSLGSNMIGQRSSRPGGGQHRPSAGPGVLEVGGRRGASGAATYLKTSGAHPWAVETVPRCPGSALALAVAVSRSRCPSPRLPERPNSALRPHRHGRRSTTTGLKLFTHLASASRQPRRQPGQHPLMPLRARRQS